MTAPWTSAVLSPLATEPVQFVVTAARTGTNLVDVLDGEVTFDEEWSPYVQARLVVPGTFLPYAHAGARVSIDVGYVLADGTRQVHELADLTVTSVTGNRPDDTVEIVAQSDEALVLESAQWSVVDIVTTYPSYNAALKDFIERALTPYVPTVLTGLSGTTSVLTNYRLRIGDDWWPHIETVRDIAGGVVYCDEARVWHIEPYTPDDSPVVDTYLTTGDVPTAWPDPLDTDVVLPVIVEETTSRSRDDWANTVVIEHEWTDTGGTHHRVAQRAVATWPDPATFGYRVHKEKRTTPVASAAECAAECAALLARTVRRGERRTITGRACYWFRPRQLRRFWVSGDDLYARITRVSFALDGSGLMTLTTRPPEPEGGEA